VRRYRRMGSEWLSMQENIGGVSSQRHAERGEYDCARKGDLGGMSTEHAEGEA